MHKKVNENVWPIKKPRQRQRFQNHHKKREAGTIAPVAEERASIKGKAYTEGQIREEAGPARENQLEEGGLRGQQSKSRSVGRCRRGEENGPRRF